MSMSLNEVTRQAMIARLNRIEGQVRGIGRMVQEPRLCVDILQQLAAAEAALNRISLAVFKFHVENCIPAGLSNGNSKAELGALADVFERFGK